MKRRLLIVMLALALAAVGTSGVLAYVKGANARAIAGMKAVSVLVAQERIPSGTSAGAALRSGLLAVQKLPAASVPADAVRSVTPALSPLLTNAAVQPGQLLLRPMLVRAVAHVVHRGVTVPPGMIEVTVHLCLPEAVAGDVHAGSQVAVFDTVVKGANAQGEAQPACDGPHQQQLGGTVQTHVVLARVQVMSIGMPATSGQASPAAAGSPSAPGSSATSGQDGVLLTLAVSQGEAERLIQVTETGLPYLALLTTASRTNADSGHFLHVRTASKATTASSRHSTPAPAPDPSLTPTPAPSPSPTPRSCPGPPAGKHPKRKPRAPTRVSALAGNESAIVTWTAPKTGSPITSYTVTPFIGSAAQTPVAVAGRPPATWATVTGLTNGTAYTFTVSATNAIGTGRAAAASNAVTPSAPTVPGTPTGVSATADNGSATVWWTAPGNGGSAIASYTVTPYIGSAAQTPITISGNPPTTSATFTGLTNGTAYTFTVSATNAIGTGPASAASNAITGTLWQK